MPPTADATAGQKAADHAVAMAKGALLTRWVSGVARAVMAGENLPMHAGRKGPLQRQQLRPLERFQLLQPQQGQKRVRRMRPCAPILILSMCHMVTASGSTGLALNEEQKSHCHWHIGGSSCPSHHLPCCCQSFFTCCGECRSCLVEGCLYTRWATNHVQMALCLSYFAFEQVPLAL